LVFFDIEPLKEISAKADKGAAERPGGFRVVPGRSGIGDAVRRPVELERRWDLVRLYLKTTASSAFGKSGANKGFSGTTKNDLPLDVQYRAVRKETSLAVARAARMSLSESARLVSFPR
jgi:hypothetical protein